MRQVSLILNENEFDKFMNSLKSFKSVKNVHSEKIDDESAIFGLTDLQRLILENQIEKHLNGESNPHSWKNVEERGKHSVN